MKWKVKKEPKDGSERWRTGFAWWPVNACDYNNEDDRYWIWLQLYNQKQRYSVSYDVIAGVSVMRWITVEDYIN